MEIWNCEQRGRTTQVSLNAFVPVRVTKIVSCQP
jgi:hypothetical protein